MKYDSDFLDNFDPHVSYPKAAKVIALLDNRSGFDAWFQDIDFITQVEIYEELEELLGD